MDNKPKVNNFIFGKILAKVQAGERNKEPGIVNLKFLLPGSNAQSLIMFTIENLYLFFTVSILINLSPGPDMIYTAARSLSQGTRAGIFSALGIFVGCLFHVTAAVFGLSQIIEESVLLFSIIKYAGAVYLIYLGI